MKVLGTTVSDNLNAWNSDQFGKLYLNSLDHFSRVSRGLWITNGREEYRWKVGWPLGTAPSFNLLALTNNECGREAAIEVGLPWKSSFRVIGDDIVMDARIFPAYAKRIQRLGGEFNPSKVIESNKAVEFAGRVITTNGSYLKRVKARDLGDDSFMEIVSSLGEQSKYLLRPRQRKVWDELKFVPGIAVSGPYSQNSHGEPLALRYQWYLEQVKPMRIEPDKTLKTGGQLAIDLVACLNETGLAGNVISDRFVPRDIWEGIHPSTTAYQNAVSGDPRRDNGRSTLEVAEATLGKGTFVSYPAFKKENLPCQQSDVSKTSPHTITPSSPRHKPKGRSR